MLVTRNGKASPRWKKVKSRKDWLKMGLTSDIRIAPEAKSTDLLPCCADGKRKRYQASSLKKAALKSQHFNSVSSKHDIPIKRQYYEDFFRNFKKVQAEP